MSDTGLANVFGARTSDGIWKRINCIQTNVKSKIGCGFPYIVNFYAKIDGKKLLPTSNIQYNF